MKIFYLDDSSKYKIVLTEAIKRLAQRTSFNLVLEHLKPDGHPDDFMFFSERTGEAVCKLEYMDHTQAGPRICYRKTTLERLAKEKEAFFIVDVNFAFDPSPSGMEYYGLWLCKFLFENGISKNQMILLTIWPELGRKEFLKDQGFYWWDQFDKRDFKVEDPNTVDRFVFRLGWPVIENYLRWQNIGDQLIVIGGNRFHLGELFQLYKTGDESGKQNALSDALKERLRHLDNESAATIYRILYYMERRHSLNSIKTLDCYRDNKITLDCVSAVKQAIEDAHLFYKAIYFGHVPSFSIQFSPAKPRIPIQIWGNIDDDNRDLSLLLTDLLFHCLSNDITSIELIITMNTDQSTPALVDIIVRFQFPFAKVKDECGAPDTQTALTANHYFSFTFQTALRLGAKNMTIADQDGMACLTLTFEGGAT